MLTVELRNLQFHAFHGIYEGESKTGNDYEVTLTVSYQEKDLPAYELKEVLNYAELYDIIAKRMGIAVPLLEEVAEGILRTIKHQYSYIKETRVSIYKLQPPIEGLRGKVGITLEKKFD